MARKRQSRVTAVGSARRTAPATGLSRRSAGAKAEEDWLFPRLATEAELDEASLLDVIDTAVNHGLVLQGDLILGVANVDLIYIKLSALVAALDKITRSSMPADRPKTLRGIDPATSAAHDQQKNRPQHARPKRSRAGRRGSRHPRR